MWYTIITRVAEARAESEEFKVTLKCRTSLGQAARIGKKGQGAIVRRDDRARRLWELHDEVMAIALAKQPIVSREPIQSEIYV